MRRPSRRTTGATCWSTTHFDSTGPRRRPRRSPGPEDGTLLDESDARPPVRRRRGPVRRRHGRVRPRQHTRVRQPNVQVQVECVAGSSSPPMSPRGSDRRRPRIDRHRLQRPDEIGLLRCLSSRLTAPHRSMDPVALRRRCLSALHRSFTPRWRYPRRRSGHATTTPDVILPRLVELHQSNSPDQPRRRSRRRTRF